MVSFFLFWEQVEITRVEGEHTYTAIQSLHPQLTFVNTHTHTHAMLTKVYV